MHRGLLGLGWVRAGDSSSGWPRPCCGFFALSLGVGSVSIPLDAVVAILWGEADQKPSWSHIIYAIRLPRALTAVLAGAALSASGLQMQTLFRNPLADPFYPRHQRRS